ncbi:HAD family hydrolase [Tropicimonas sp. S265A]|uniref:HAD family hydrolase n=1 Tax=Tropicimonas sp. S265A TaxID=3415134 RepID=UPI003C7DE637
MLAGVIFDKDGTLFDFQRTWGSWAQRALARLARGDDTTCQRLSDAVRFDRLLGRFHADSPAIAGTNAEIAIILAAELPERSEEEVLLELNGMAQCVTLSEATPLVPFLSGLAGSGLRLGVATNDTEDAARAHLQSAGALSHFDQVFGYDSGYGAKPDPGMLYAFCDFEGLDPSTVIMVGDSTHDLRAGRAAGMKTIGVLTGMATEPDLAPLADEVLPDIGQMMQGRLVAEMTAPAQRERA